MDVSVIIVNYHSSELVVNCINSIYEKTNGVIFEIIVVDNASNDGSVELLKDIFGNKITVISSDINLGFGKANNLGEKYATGEYIFLLNPDTILVNNAIKILRDALDKNKEIGSVGGNLYTPDMTPCPSYSLKFDDLTSEKEYATWRNIIGNKIYQKIFVNRLKRNKDFEKNFNHSDNVLEVAYIFGADMMMKKSLFEKIGGFDSDFFMYAEEQELSWRIHQEAKKNCNIPQAKIVHLEGATIKEQDAFSEMQFKMRMNGIMIYFRKRYGINGVHEFYKFRALRYKHLITLAKIRQKDLTDFGPALQLRCLSECYYDFINGLDEENLYGRS